MSNEESPTAKTTFKCGICHEEKGLKDMNPIAPLEICNYCRDQGILWSAVQANAVRKAVMNYSIPDPGEKSA